MMRVHTHSQTKGMRRTSGSGTRTDPKGGPVLTSNGGTICSRTSSSRQQIPIIFVMAERWLTPAGTILTSLTLCCAPMRPTRKASPSSKAQINPADNPDDAKFYIDCDELARNGHFSYLMNFLGATLLHGYTW